MMRNDDPLPRRETGNSAATFDHCTGEFVPQDDRRGTLLRNLDDIGATESTTMHTHK